jgi:hypothetical protein
MECRISLKGPYHNIFASCFPSSPRLELNVLDLVSQVRDAILMNVYLGGEKPGIEQGERIGEFSLQAIGDQGGRILLQQGGFQVSERGSERGARGARGISKGDASCIL